MFNSPKVTTLIEFKLADCIETKPSVTDRNKEEAIQSMAFMPYAGPDQPMYLKSLIMGYEQTFRETTVIIVFVFP